MFFVQPALALVRTRRFSFFEFYYFFSLYFLFLCFFLTANVFILFKYTLFFRNMGSLFSSSVAISTDYTFNAASDGSAQVGKGSQRSVQALGNSASGIGTAATGSGRVICSPLMGISGAIQPDVKYGSDTYARRVYWMAEDGELSNPKDLESCLMLPGWYQTIDDKLTKNNYHVDEFKKRVQLVVSLGDKDLSLRRSSKVNSILMPLITRFTSWMKTGTLKEGI